jgi:SMODS and SLOG-associating 2TM effector domain 1
VTARDAQYVAAYRRHRLDHQNEYYAARAATLERARRLVITLSSLLMVVAAFFGALGAADADGRARWAFIAASVAAVGTAFTSFEAAFGLERYARVYGEAHRALTVASAETPRPAELDGGDGRVGQFTERVERILADEVDTWSEYTKQPGEPEQPDGPGAVTPDH